MCAPQVFAWRPMLVFGPRDYETHVLDQAPRTIIPAQQITFFDTLLQDDTCLLFRRNYIFLGFVFASAFAFEMSFDRLMDKAWDKNNAGRQWKDIRSRYIQDGDEE